VQVQVQMQELETKHVLFLVSSKQYNQYLQMADKQIKFHNLFVFNRKIVLSLHHFIFQFSIVLFNYRFFSFFKRNQAFVGSSSSRILVGYRNTYVWLGTGFAKRGLNCSYELALAWE